MGDVVAALGDAHDADLAEPFLRGAADLVEVIEIAADVLACRLGEAGAAQRREDDALIGLAVELDEEAEQLQPARLHDHRVFEIAHRTTASWTKAIASTKRMQSR